MRHGRKKNEIIRENICLLLYIEKFEKEQVAPIFYGKRNTRVNEYIDELTDKGWIKQDDRQLGKNKFTYCSTLPKCFVDVVIDALSKNDRTLETKEIKKLNDYFSTFAFKDWYNKLFSILFKKLIDTSLVNGFTTFLEILSFRFIFYSLYRELNINDKELVDIINEIGKNWIDKEEFNKKSIPEFDILGLSLIKKLVYAQPEIKVNFYLGMLEVYQKVILKSNKK